MIISIQIRVPEGSSDERLIQIARRRAKALDVPFSRVLVQALRLWVQRTAGEPLSPEEEARWREWVAQTAQRAREAPGINPATSEVASPVRESLSGSQEV